MEETSTERFLRLLNEQNIAIAAREAEIEKNKPQPDLIRLQREQERREKWGTLRAREKPHNRSHRAHNVFGYTDLS